MTFAAKRVTTNEGTLVPHLLTLWRLHLLRKAWISAASCLLSTQLLSPITYSCFSAKNWIFTPSESARPSTLIYFCTRLNSIPRAPVINSYICLMHRSQDSGRALGEMQLSTRHRPELLPAYIYPPFVLEGLCARVLFWLSLVHCERERCPGNESWSLTFGPSVDTRVNNGYYPNFCNRRKGL